MVRTQAKDYNQSENDEENFKELVSIIKIGGSLLSRMIVNHFQRWNFNSFENMDDLR